MNNESLMASKRAKELGTDAHIDHILPLSRGGENVDDNAQLLCPYCNLSKGSKTMEEWKGI